MKVSYNWLKKYIQTELSPEDLGKILTAAHKVHLNGQANFSRGIQVAQVR